MRKFFDSSMLLKHVFVPATAFILFTLAACSAKESPAPGPPALFASTTTPTLAAHSNVLTEQQKLSLVEFAKGLTSLERDWDRFHESYNGWFRTRNIPMEPDMEKSLGQFPNRFQQIRHLITGLPTTYPTESVVDKLFEAALAEEKALRSMRDSWKPGDMLVFQRYEESRSTIEKARLDIKKGFAERVAAAEPENKESIEKLHRAYRDVAAEWDTCHQDYDDWKAKGMEKEPPSKALPNFVARQRSILTKIYGLPRPLIGQSVLDLLVSAGEKDELAMRRLNENWKPKSDEVFATYELERLNVEKMRNQVGTGLEELRQAGSEVNRGYLSTFSASLRDINKQWDEFHSAYDSWRNPGADANRDAISKELKEFASRSNSVVGQARTLPQNALLRPLSESVITAAEKEQQGLLRLQESWKPYDSTAWRAFEQEQQVADKARRQIRGVFTDLLAKHNLSLADVTR